ncbi:MAG: LysR family transcriptional regulator [Verrucomicrobiota bacterium]
MFESLFSRGGLSLDRLRSFLEVAEAGSISKAASRDLSRQALISRQIRELEEYFGTELTHRSGKTIVISPAGRRLAILIREQFQDLNDFCVEQHKQAKDFSLGAGASILEWMVIPAAAKIRRALGNSSLRLSSSRSHDLVQHIREGRLDFAIVREDAIPKPLPRIPLTQVKFHICVSRRLIGGQPKARLDDLAYLQTLPFAATGGRGQLDQTFRQAMAATTGSFSPAFECDSLLQVRELVIQGACAALLPSLGIQGLAEQEILIREFTSMKTYGRALALHWNERQMRRRGIELAEIQKMSRALIKP